MENRKHLLPWRGYKTVSLCKQCQQIPLENIFAGNYEGGIVFEEARSIADVEKRSQTCGLCRFVLRSFKQTLPSKRDRIFGVWKLRKRERAPKLATVKYSLGQRNGEVLFGYEKKALRLTILGQERFCIKVQPFGDGCPLSGGHLVSPVSPNFQLIKAWIANCVSNHGSTCESLGWAESQHNLTNAFVVDVVDEVLRPLVLPDMKFVALSYVVGASRRRQRKQKCEFAELTDSLPLKAVMPNPPQTVKDAILLVRMIGERYLWVDCLSISSGHQEHQMNQIQQMHRVYSSALLSIIVADGADGESGIVGISEKAGRITQLSEKYSPDKFLAELLPVDETGLPSSIWNSRAWILQEQLLSRRCLICCEGQFYWRCKEDAFCEDYPISMKPKGRRFIDQMPFRLDSLFPQRTIQSCDGLFAATQSPESSEALNSDLQVIFAAYCWTVAEYMRRDLSFPEDVNTAFRGIEMLLSEHLGTTSWWSLPESLFHRALLWYPGYANVLKETLPNLLKTRSSQSTPYPSWAWCGWMGKITYFSPREYIVSLGGSKKVDLFFSNTKVAPTVAWSRYEGNSRIVINRDHLMNLCDLTSDCKDLQEGSPSTNREHHALERSLKHELACCSSTEVLESTAKMADDKTYIFTYGPVWCLSQFSVRTHLPLEKSYLLPEHPQQDLLYQLNLETGKDFGVQLRHIGGMKDYMFTLERHGYGYLDSKERLHVGDVHVIAVSRAEIGQVRPRDDNDNWLSQYVESDTSVHDVIYVVFDKTGDFKGRRARRVGIGIMSDRTFKKVETSAEWREIVLG